MKHSALFLLLLCALCSNACLDDVQQRPPSSDASPDSNDEKEDSDMTDMTDISSCTDLGKEDIYVDARASDAPEKCQNMDQTEGVVSCTKNAPCKTLAKGVETLSAERNHINVAHGTYLESSTIMLDKEFEVTITGEIDDIDQPGMSENIWPVITLDVSTTMPDTTMNIVGNGMQKVTLKDLTIKGPDLSNLMHAGIQKHGRIAYTLKASNFQPKLLTLDNVNIIGGTGGPGQSGTSGDLPMSGLFDGNGQNGGATCQGAFPPSQRGGGGGNCQGSIDAQPGVGYNLGLRTIEGGKEGRSECRIVINEELSCLERSGEAGTGGDKGLKGQKADPGAMENAPGTFAFANTGDVVWTSSQHTAPPNDANTGSPGAGGGGGGGAFADSVTPQAGQPGGGGGGGGCPGQSGTPGHSGGASIALTLHQVSLIEGDIQIQHGTGGQGGDGGNSTEGGLGGKGTKITLVYMCPPGELGKALGGDGGDGGPGGDGEPGIGGCPGSVVGILTDTPTTLTYQSKDSINLGVPGDNGKLIERDNGSENVLQDTCKVIEQKIITLTAP